MSYSNDFKAFAIGSGANVETPTTWAGDSVVNLGFQSGTALSIKFNTVLRQASSMAQMIGDFTAQYGPGNVQDNGDITTLKTQFISALGGLLGNGIFKANDTGTANAVAIVVPNITLGAGQCFLVKKSTSGNTGATTINLNGLGAISVVWADGTALIAGDWPASVTGLVEYDGAQFNLLSFIGPTVFARANALGAITGGYLNLVGKQITTTTATWTADEIVVKTALGGVAHALSAYNQTLNVATVGAGGMDTGAAPVSNWLYVYAIFNPTTGAASILGTSGGVGQSIYPGSNLPSGYTYSALIGTFRTNTSSQIPIFLQRQNVIAQPQTAVLAGGAATALTAVNISSGVPPNAKTVDLGVSNSSGASGTFWFAYDAAGVIFGSSSLSTAGWSIQLWDVMMMTPQTIYYYQAGGLSISISIGQYTI